MFWYIDVFESRVNLALKNWAPAGTGEGEDTSGGTVGISVEVGVSTGGEVGVTVSAVGGAGVKISIWNVQPEIKKTIPMRNACILFIANPS
jgi:hypothetical protein